MRVRVGVVRQGPGAGVGLVLVFVIVTVLVPVIVPVLRVGVETMEQKSREWDQGWCMVRSGAGACGVVLVLVIGPVSSVGV